jgi:Zn-dependent M28 family amino/carboxypeptidase
MFLTSIIGVVYFVAYIITTIIIQGAGVISINGTPLIMGLVCLVFVPFWIGMYWFSNTKEVVDGANDNLTACLMSMAVLKTLKEENIEFENTEVCALLTGSEEAGLRGAKAFAKAHKDDFNDCETIFIPMETLREIEHLTIYTKDLNGLVKADKDVAALIKKAAQNIGIDIPYGTVTVGSTDAAALCQGGLKACCLAALDHNLKDYYHTRRDSYDNLDKECLGVVYDIVMETLDLYDKEGLSGVAEK